MISSSKADVDRKMTERELEGKLKRILERALAPKNARTYTFEEAGVMTENRGIVLQLDRGRQVFQITVVEDLK